MTTETFIAKGEITNTCTCVWTDEYGDEILDDNGDTTPMDCYGDCWKDSVYDFGEVTKELRESNESNMWQVEDLALWHGTVSGTFEAKTVEDLLCGMTVNGEWIMRYTVFDDRVEYSLSHHDANGSCTVLRPAQDLDEDNS